ncbi:MAG: GspH/FimT family pseudopilin [Nitrospiraceae bacterium]|nr:GspH/FimT family pseudopilin [Nitrospiraceae bacterium]
MNLKISPNPSFKKRGALFVERGGFTLIELLVVLAILAILAVIGFSMFSGQRGQSEAESEIKQIYADLMNAREQAVAQKRWVYVVFGASNSYVVWVDTNPAPDGDNTQDAGDTKFINRTPNLLGMTLSVSGTPPLNISPDGIMTDSAGATTGTIDITPAVNTDQALLDCISWTPTNMEMGNWQPGGNCVIK